MRRLLLPVLLLLALPAAAQDDGREVERLIRIEIDTVLTDGGAYEIEVERDDDVRERRVIIRRGEGEEDVVAFRLPGGDDAREMLGRAASDAIALFRTEGSGSAFEHYVTTMNASPETRRRMRELEAQAVRLAETVRDADGAERRDARADLDRTLDELFDVRAEARREQAEALRERARTLQSEADQLDAELADREARRAELIEARRRMLLDGADW